MKIAVLVLSMALVASMAPAFAGQTDNVIGKYSGKTGIWPFRSTCVLNIQRSDLSGYIDISLQKGANPNQIIETGMKESDFEAGLAKAGSSMTIGTTNGVFPVASGSDTITIQFDSTPMPTSANGEEDNQLGFIGGSVKVSCAGLKKNQ